MISTAILETMWVWNDYLLPTLVLDIKKYRTIPMAIQYFRGSYGRVEMGPMMACIMITVHSADYRDVPRLPEVHHRRRDRRCGEGLTQAELICAERKPYGIVFLGSNLEYFTPQLAELRVPCLLLTNSAATLNIPNLSSVSVDDVWHRP